MSDSKLLKELLSNSTISGLFGNMDIAEYEINMAKENYSKRKDEIQDSFKYLCPPPIFRGKSMEVYRYHVKEIIKRIAMGKDKQKHLEIATDAEVMLHISEFSLKTPIINDLSYVYYMIFKKIFPKEARKFKENFYESWKGRGKELLNELKVKFKTKRG